MLLRDAGLDSNPIVLPTVSRGQLLDYSPTISQLNYVIANVQYGDKVYYYDATTKTGDVYELPKRALNGRGILMTPKEAKLVDVFYPQISKTVYSIDAKMNPDGTFEGEFSDLDEDLSGFLSNELYLEGKDKYEQLYKDQYKFPFTDIKSGTTENGNFETTFNFNGDTFADVIGSKIVFNPLLFLYSQTHDYTQTEPRKAPLEFSTAREVTKRVTITIPEGYVFENVPASKKFRTEDNGIAYLYKVTPEGNNKLTIESVVTTDDSTYPAEYYEAFRQIYNNITKLEGQVVTAVKK